MESSERLSRNELHWFTRPGNDRRSVRFCCTGEVADGGGLGVVEGPAISTDGVTIEWYLAGAEDKLLGTEWDAMVACLLEDVPNVLR